MFMLYNTVQSSDFVSRSKDQYKNKTIGTLTIAEQKKMLKKYAHIINEVKSAWEKKDSNENKSSEVSNQSAVAAASRVAVYHSQVPTEAHVVDDK